VRAVRGIVDAEEAALTVGTAVRPEAHGIRHRRLARLGSRD
jgi:hypothetical protein